MNKACKNSPNLEVFQMKKFGFVMLSIFTVVLGSFLTACNFKKVEVSFTQSEVVFSQGQTFDMNQIVKVKETSSSKISYRVSNPDMFEIDGSKLTAKDVSGKSFVYAMFEGNSLASTELIVKKPFDCPKNFVVDGNGLLSWDLVSDTFADESLPTYARNFKIEGKHIVKSESEEDTVLTVNETVSTNKFQLESGIYELSFTTLGRDYFDNSKRSPIQKFYVGFMPQLTFSDFSWNDGLLSWSIVENAKFTVKVDEKEIATQTANSIDLTETLNEAKEGKHSFSIVVSDNSDSQNKKFDQETETFYITKHSTPYVQLINGQVSAVSETADNFAFTLTSQTDEKVELVKGSGATSFDGEVSAGLHTLNISALGNVVENGQQEFFFRSETYTDKIYKLSTPKLEATGNNQIGGTSFNLLAEVEEILSTKLRIYNSDKMLFETTFETEQSKNLTVFLPTAGQHEIYASLKTAGQGFVGEGTSRAYVINSDSSEIITATKVGNFKSEITHEYFERVSKLSFKAVDFATKYDCIALQSLKEGKTFEFQTTISNNIVTLTFSDRIENLLDVQGGQIDLQIVAQTENEKTCISSVSSKVLKVLSAPDKQSEMNSTNKNFSWGTVENAQFYRLQIFTLSLQEFQQLSENEEFDISSTPTVIETEENSYTFESEGYYCVKVFAINENENEFVETTQFLQQTFYIQKRLELNNVQFGFDENLIQSEGQTDANGYFLQISASEDVDKFDIFVDDQKTTFNKIGQNTIFLLSNDFHTSHSIRVIGKAEDETIYVSTTAQILNVEKLESVTEDDLNTFLFIDDFKPQQKIVIDVKQKEGVRKLQATQSGNATFEGTDNLKIDISDLNTFDLSIKLFGSELDSQTKIFEISETGKVFLDSDASVMNFKRINGGSDLQYYDGTLKFVHQQMPNTDFYVLDVVCVTNNENQKLTFSIRMQDNVTANINDQRISLGQKNEFFSTGGDNFDEVHINLNKIIDKLKQNAVLADLYNQAKEISFAVYAHRTKFVNAENVFELSSNYATTKQDASKTQLVLKKVPSVEVDYDQASHTLVWQAPTIDLEYENDTVYEIDINNAQQQFTTKATNFKLSESMTNGNFFVTVKNPYFLESANSNLVMIKKLKTLSQIALAENGTLSFVVDSENVDVCQSAILEIDETERYDIDVKDGIGVFGWNAENSVALKAGKFKIKLMGSHTSQTDGTQKYYLDSDFALWNLVEMDSAEFAPSNKSISVLGNVISWDAVNVDNGQVEYVLIFKDKNNAVASFTTTNNFVNWLEEDSLRTSLYSLADEEIEIQLVAHMKAHCVANGGKVYFSNKVSLLNGLEKYNHLSYTNQTITKFSAPEIVSVEFENPQSTETKPDTQTPTIKLTISGNYGSNATFQVFRAGKDDQPIMTLTSTANVDGNFEIVLQPEDYNNFIDAGADLDFQIFAISEVENTISSSGAVVTISRAHDLKNISFETETFGFGQKLNIAYDVLTNTNKACEIAGGVVLTLVFDDGTLQTTLHKFIETSSAFEDGLLEGNVTFDLSNLIATYLQNGGTVSVQAYIKSHSNGTMHILASNIKESEIFEVLASASEVALKDDGFEIVDTNSLQDLAYVVVTDKGQSRVIADESGRYFFAMPKDWANGQHDVTIFATALGKVKSAKSQISVSLDRIDSVGEIRLTRSSNLQGVISWDAVKETDIKFAEGYVLKVYRRTNETKGKLLFTFEGEQTSYTLAEIFGQNYCNLMVEGGIANFAVDNDIWIEIITKGGTKNNSYAKDVFATIKANNTTSKDFSVDMFGNVLFDKNEQNFIYRFVSGDGSEIVLDENNFSNWQRMQNKVLNISNLPSNSPPFNVEIKVLGTAEETSLKNPFILDSATYSTVISGAPTFMRTPAIKEIRIDETSQGQLIFVLETDQFDCLYVGLSENAIFDASLQDENAVLKIQPILVGRGDENNEHLFAYSLADIISAFTSKDLQGQTTLYFWVCNQNAQDEENQFVNSEKFAYSITLQSDLNFGNIFKGQYTTDKNVEVSDFVNTFVTFEKDEFTTGIFAKFDWQEEDLSKTKTLFIEKDKLLENSDKFESFAINLLQIVENDEDLKNVFGKLDVDFARVSLNTTEENSTFVVSNWLSADGQSITFQRLENVQSVEVRNGNLVWSANNQLTTHYYVYFFSNIEENVFTFAKTQNTTFNVSDFAGKDSQYYVAVQCVDENNNTSLASSKVFKLSNGEPQKIYKNQINSPIKLSGGTLYIDWTQGDFYKALTQPTENFYELAKKLVDPTTVFTSPFTFTLKDLVDGSVYVRMRFSPQTDAGASVGKTYDVNATNLLASLISFGTENNFDVLERLNTLYDHSENLTVAERRLLDRFKMLVEQSSFGVANPRFLFDEVFESLQMGKYGLEYCLITENGTINSEWYEYSNINNENVIFVNGQPDVAVKIVPVEDSINQFKVVFEKSMIWNYVEGLYVKTEAERYILKLGKDAYSVYKDENKYKLMKLDANTPVVLPVYECDSAGNENGLEREYLMFYLNHNNGKSLLGAYEIENKNSQEMQIYAVGNDVSISSKSKYFNATFLSFEDFSVVEGVFVWTTYNNRQTKVYVKNNRSSTWEDPVFVDGGLTASQFSLEGKAGGTYSLKFVMEGETRENTIFVDSEIFIVENVFKLDSPTLSNTKGLISISVDLQTKENLQNTYSDSALYRYMISNDRSFGLSIIVSGNESGQTYMYEAGATNLGTNDPSYPYKSTEERATRFDVKMLGTTASLAYETLENWHDGFNANYHLKKIVCLDASGQATTKGIALQSTSQQMKASMLSNVDKESLVVENGIVKWNAVEGRVDSATGQQEKIEAGASVIYKITVSQYVNSSSSTGQASTNLTEDLVFFTAQNHFDLVLLPEDPEIQKHDPLIAVSIQAFALNITQQSTDRNAVSLVEGGFAEGNVCFVSQTDWFVLMSNGVSLRDIKRLNPVENLDVVDGKLTWQFTTTDNLVDETNFKEFYDFIVMDDESNVIDGEISLSKNGNTFTATFQECAGQMKVGNYDVSVFVTQGTRNVYKVIKSFARTLNITKLQTITAQDYVIDTNSSSLQSEIFSLEKYFMLNPNNIVQMTVLGAEQQKFVFTSLKNKLYILKTQIESDDLLDYGTDFVFDENGKGYVVVGSDSVEINFKVLCENPTEKVIYSDVSDNFALHRTNWEGYSVSWDETKQKFVWDFALNSFNRNVDAIRMKNVNVLINQTEYFDADGNQIGVLQAGSEVDVVKENENQIEIMIDGISYFIAKNSIQKMIVQDLDSDGNEQIENLNISDLFEIVEEGNENSIICVSEHLFNVPTSAIVKPIFIVEATYTDLSNNTEVRTYTTKQKEFTPTIIGKVKIKVSIKINDVNVVSEEFESQQVNFNLFAQGRGTAQNPYVISDETQFLGIKNRMVKDESLKKYVFNNQTIEDADNFHFVLENDIVLTSVQGIVFAGEFSGVLNGDGHLLTYTCSNVQKLSNNVTVSQSAINLTEDSNLTYTHGSAIFENFSTSANVKNLKISATFGKKNSVKVQYHSLMAGLVIVNNGRIENVQLDKFKNHFYGDFNDPKYRAFMTYSGLASINNSSAIISNCLANCDMKLLDLNSPQVISISGIVYHNYGTVEKCIAGRLGQTIALECDDRRNSFQMAGVAITNATTSAIITQCENNFKIEIKNWSSSTITGFMAGVVVLNKGEVNAVNNASIPVAPSNVEATIGNVIAKT